jgi:hypothetical protein
MRGVQSLKKNAESSTYHCMYTVFTILHNSTSKINTGHDSALTQAQISETGLIHISRWK